jgi:transcriptional regulator with XRE-family HTH domain
MPRKSKTSSGSALAIRIGGNIKSARTLVGLTQGQLAEALDLENVTISRIETGAQMPSIERLDEISKVLKVSLTALIADPNERSAVSDMLVDAIAGLPEREKKFVYEFAATYARHWKAGKKKP